MEEQKLTATLKGVALVCLVGSGVIQREEDGSVDTEAFERFWARFERNLDITLENAVAQRCYATEDTEKRKRRDATLRDIERIANVALPVGLVIVLALLAFVIVWKLI